MHREVAGLPAMTRGIVVKTIGRTLTMVACTAALLCGSCGPPVRAVPPECPEPGLVQTELRLAGLPAEYASCAAGRLEPLGDGRFIVLFKPVEYRGLQTHVPFPMCMTPTNGGWVVYYRERGNRDNGTEAERHFFIRARRSSARYQ